MGSPQFHNLFGESKTLRQWSFDPRCKVKYSRLHARIKYDGMTLEQALTKERRNTNPKGTLRTAFGEFKTLTEWSRDSRCAVCLNTLTDRLKKGMSLEAALTTPPANCGRNSPYWGTGIKPPPAPKVPKPKVEKPPKVKPEKVVEKKEVDSSAISAMYAAMAKRNGWCY